LRTKKIAIEIIRIESKINNKILRDIIGKTSSIKKMIKKNYNKKQWSILIKNQKKISIPLIIFLKKRTRIKSEKKKQIERQLWNFVGLSAKIKEER